MCSAPSTNARPVSGSTVPEPCHCPAKKRRGSRYCFYLPARNLLEAGHAGRGVAAGQRHAGDALCAVAAGLAALLAATVLAGVVQAGARLAADDGPVLWIVHMACPVVKETRTKSLDSSESCQAAAGARDQLVWLFERCRLSNVGTAQQDETHRSAVLLDRDSTTLASFECMLCDPILTICTGTVSARRSSSWHKKSSVEFTKISLHNEQLRSMRRTGGRHARRTAAWCTAGSSRRRARTRRSPRRRRRRARSPDGWRTRSPPRGQCSRCCPARR